VNSILAALAFVLSLGIVLITGFVGANGLLICAPAVAVAAWIISRVPGDRKFLLQIFIAAFLVRVLLGTLIYVFELQEFFGGDANTYDFFGYALLRSWEGDKFSQMLVNLFLHTGGSGWGMSYFVAAVYKIVGQNPLAVQYLNALLGAATAVITYLIALDIFGNRRVARVTGLAVALFPSLVLWSSQELKDGPILFLLAVTMLATLRLGARFSLKHLAVLTLALFCLLTLRFYVFYMAAAAVTAAFLIGTRAVTAQSLLRQVVIMTTMGVAMFYFGVTRYAAQEFQTYGSGEMLQRMRSDQAVSAASGFGREADVSTTSGALSTIPLGLTYLLLAPFPWQMLSLRSLITLPEMLVWWASLPLLITGFWFSVKHRLRQISPILIFTVMLTFAYSVFQGNVGNAYRQRAQLLIFYFIFVAVGFVLYRESREEREPQRFVSYQPSPQRMPRPSIPETM
jgi:hypothetical protein